MAAVANPWTAEGSQTIEAPTAKAAPDISHKPPKLEPKWPEYHITGPWGWMNDPCGPGYDPVSKTYHLFYQWNPKGTEWGNISWGHLWSNDQVHWQRNGVEPVLAPGSETEQKTLYDREAIFTGCMYPTGPEGDEGRLTTIYTSVRKFPFHFTTPPYPRGAAGLSAAISDDYGRTWRKHPSNPFLAEEPEGVQVTGFRDPYINPWPAVAAIRGKDPGTLYGVMSGGVQDECTAVFLYEVDPKNLLQWNYVGPLITRPHAFRPSRKWCGDSGVNWECTNFMTLTSKSGASRDFLITGTEGGEERDHIIEEQKASIGIENPKGADVSLPQRTPRWTMWLSGIPVKSEDGKGVSLDYKFGGIFDHGILYAPNSFIDGSNGKRVVWGWLIEEDVPPEYCSAKGWTGCLSLPREAFLQELTNVIGTIKSPLTELACFDIEPSSNSQVWTVRTMGIKPLTVLDKIRLGAPLAQIDSFASLSLPRRSSLIGDDEVATHTDVLVPGARWEIEASISVQPDCSRVGFRLQNGSGPRASRTTIAFTPQDEEITVKRPKPTKPRRDSTSMLIVNDREERGPHTLFTYADGSTERLHLRIFRDGQVLEVFANERFALSTMIYADDEDAEEEVVLAFAETFSSEGKSGEQLHVLEKVPAVAAVFEDVKVWEVVDSVVTQTRI